MAVGLGDVEQKRTQNRKYSATEAMRSAAPRESVSPPDVLVSPIRELPLSPLLLNTCMCSSSIIFHIFTSPISLRFIPPSLHVYMVSGCGKAICSITVCVVVSMDELICKLEQIWTSLASNPPYLLYRHVCQSLGLLHHTRGDQTAAAFYLSESLAITFSHKSHLTTASKQM